MDSKALFNLSYGIFVLGTKTESGINDCSTNTCIQVAADPVRIAISVINKNKTCEMIKESGVFSLGVLDKSCTFDLIKHFGMQSGRDVNKFADFPYTLDVNGCPVINQSVCSVFSCKVVSKEDLGTHTLFIATVTDMETISDTPSATYTYYQSHIKEDLKPAGKTAEGKTIWKCTVCGYEYVGDVLPEDFICPLCKHPASDFEKVQ